MEIWEFAGKGGALGNYAPGELRPKGELRP